MGIRNQGFYTPTEHFVERVYERFQQSKTHEQAKKFFNIQAQTCEYVGTSKNDKGLDYEVWQNDKVVFILDPSKFKMITTYPIGFRYQEQEGNLNDIKISDETKTNLTRSIDNEIYSGYLGFIDRNEDMVQQAVKIMSTMKGTRRRDYREKQIADLEVLLNTVIVDLKKANESREKLEGMKSFLV